MESKDVSELLKQLKIYRNSYINSLTENEWNDLKRDWFNQLKEYDYEDVKSKLDSFFATEKNLYAIPSSYYLKEGLYKSTQKFQPGKIYCRCQVCGRLFEHSFEKRNDMARNPLTIHEDRCRSVRYLKKLYKDYFNRAIDETTENDLFRMSEEKFNETYFLILEKTYKKMPDGFDKKLLENVLNTRKEE